MDTVNRTLCKLLKIFIYVAKIQESYLIQSNMQNFSRTYQQNITSVSILSNFKKIHLFINKTKQKWIQNISNETMKCVRRLFLLCMFCRTQIYRLCLKM